MNDYTKATDQFGNYWEKKGEIMWWYYSETDVKTGIVCCVEVRINNRGITLANYKLSGERLQFTLKPSLWKFEK